MTIAVERTWAVNKTRKFLIDLMNPSTTPKVPKAIRQRASDLLKHYPGEYDMKRIGDVDNDVFSNTF
jgi:hypothetical protein